MRYLLPALLLSAVFSAPASAQPPAPTAAPAPPSVPHLTERQKIDRMLELLAASDATFIRNGAEYNGKDAAAHLRSKLSAAGDLIPSARAFIDQIASKSSASGRPYQVRPRDGKAIDSAQWFNALLVAIENPAPAAPPIAAVTITVDATEAPDLKEWGDTAKAICEKWYPIICKELDSEGFTPATSVRIVFRVSMRAPAATGGGTISVNAPYVEKHRDDYGMMVHELTHVVQAYQGGKGGANMGWLTEGIADYIRFYKYEPGADHSRINVQKASYRDSYRTTARFLNFLAEKHDPKIVQKLNARMRAGTCDESTFKELLGKDIVDLWKEFIATLRSE